MAQICLFALAGGNVRFPGNALGFWVCYLRLLIGIAIWLLLLWLIWVVVLVGVYYFCCADHPSQTNSQCILTKVSLIGSFKGSLVGDEGSSLFNLPAGRPPETPFGANVVRMIVTSLLLVGDYDFMCFFSRS